MNRHIVKPTFHQPFDSVYRTDIEVIEEWHDAVRLFVLANGRTPFAPTTGIPTLRALVLNSHIQSIVG